MSSESQTAVAEGRGSRDCSPESPGSADVSDGSTPCGVAEHRPCQLLFDVHERRETKGGDGGARAESARRRSDSRRHLAGRAATTRAYSFRSADDRIETKAASTLTGVESTVTGRSGGGISRGRGSGAVSVWHNVALGCVPSSERGCV